MKITRLLNTSKYLAFDLIKNFQEIVLGLYRNRFDIQIEFDETKHYSDRASDFIIAMTEFCEELNFDFWSYDEGEGNWIDDDGFLLADESPEPASAAVINFKVFFMNREDAQRFHDTFLVLYKLSN